MNTNQSDDKEAINQFLHLGRLLFQIRSQHPSMSETDILQMSRLMTTVASGTLLQAVSQKGRRLIEKLSVAKEPEVKGKPGRKAKLAKMTPEERQTRILKALEGSAEGLLAGEIAKKLGLRGAQGLSPTLVKLGRVGLIRVKKGTRKGESVWTATPHKTNGKSTNGAAHHATYAPN